MEPDFWRRFLEGVLAGLIPALIMTPIIILALRREARRIIRDAFGRKR